MLKCSGSTRAYRLEEGNTFALAIPLLQKKFHNYLTMIPFTANTDVTDKKKLNSRSKYTCPIPLVDSLAYPPCKVDDSITHQWLREKKEKSCEKRDGSSKELWNTAVVH
jgi:hypothetical protein